MSASGPLPSELIERLLAQADKPARYTGGELNSIAKLGPVRSRMALCFPDLYEVAESYLGFKILYDIVNQHPDYAAERVYALAPELETQAREAGVPLWSLETRRPLAAFDVVGFTLQYELCYPTIVAMLEHGGVPVRAAARRETDPIVVGGGGCAFNPEPVAPFFDAILLGDGEEAVLDILNVISAGRERGIARAEILRALAQVPGIYVPSHFRIEYDGLAVRAIDVLPGSPYERWRSKQGTPRVRRRTIASLDEAPFPARPLVPNVQPVHHRVTIEIQRGCSRGCRFCQAGMTGRPTRQRRPETVLALADRQLGTTGHSEVSLLSLSAGDYAPMPEVLTALMARHRDERVAVSLPSLRTETLTPEIAQKIAEVRKSSFTLAPEAATERLRRVINKTNREEDLLRAVRAAIEAGWRQLKLYFMVGLPTETREDVEAIAELALKARAAGRSIRRSVDVTVSVSTFVPKPHTPFQWEAQLGLAETRTTHGWLRDKLRGTGIPMRYHAAEQCFVEGVLARGDRRLAEAIEKCARAGARLDAWTEYFDLGRWTQALGDALAPHALTAEDYLRARPEGDLLPWDHLDSGILKKFLVHDRHRAWREATLADCALTARCYACGGCDLGDPYLERKDARGKRLVVLEPEVHDRGEAALGDRRAVPAPKARLSPNSRLRFRYAKSGRAVYLSHLDTMEHVLRAVRLSGLPVVYTQGHTPRPRVGFSPACPTGIESRAEYFEVDCSGFPDAHHDIDKLNACLPDGLRVLDAQDLPPNAPSLNEVLLATTYTARAPESISTERLASWASEFMARSGCPVLVSRKGGTRLIDARHVVQQVRVTAEGLQITVRSSRTASLKIVEALAGVVGPEVAARARICKDSITLGSRRPAVDPPIPGPASGVDALDLTALGHHEAPSSES